MEMWQRLEQTRVVRWQKGSPTVSMKIGDVIVVTVESQSMILNLSHKLSATIVGVSFLC
jgi:hypothetical protein